MNTSKIQNLIQSLESIKSAKFTAPNHFFIGFTSDFKSACGPVIRLHPVDDLKGEMMRELNEAIKPVLEKYEKVLEEAIKNEI